jgi:tetratricopeptide (TPR) repeat protein
MAPDSAQAALTDAVGHHRAGRLAEAERRYRQVLRADERNAEALHGLGLIAQQVGNLAEASRLMRAAIAADMRADVYRSNLGNVLQMLGLFEEAAGEYKRALMLRPDSVAALSNLGAALVALGRPEEAEARLTRAAELIRDRMPVLGADSAQVHDNLGNALQAQGRLEKAVASHERALALMPENSETHGNLGLAMAGLGRWDEAMACFERGLALAPGNARIQLARAQLQLLRGDFAQGLANYEWRKRVHGERRLEGREWRGEALAAGEVLLLYAEQGLGDTVQFLRYVPWVQARLGGGLILEVQEPLRRLALELPGEPRVVVAGEPLSQFDWHCSLVSLPLVLHGEGLGPGWISVEVPYLAMPEEARRKIIGIATRQPAIWSGISEEQTSGERTGLSPSLPAHDDSLGLTPGINPRPTLARGRSQDMEREFRVGLVWAGNRAHVRDRFRSIPFSGLEALLAVSGARFYSLQLGDAAAEGSGQMTDLRVAVGDMADTAALIERLDLVIGVDTAVVHLTGALGKAVWTLLPFWPDWRWGLGREDCPWYPTMRLFRQERPGDWGGVMEAVRMALVEEVGRGWRHDEQRS